MSTLDKNQLINKEEIQRLSLDPSQFLLELLKNFPKADVVKKHFGLLGEEKDTLEGIGHLYGITRERVRQIQVKVLEEIEKFLREKSEKAKNFREIFKAIEDEIISFLKRYGGLAEEKFLLKKFLKRISEDQNKEKKGRDLLFFLGYLSQAVEKMEEDEFLRRGWKIKGSSSEEMKKVIEEVKEIFYKIHHPLLKEELIKEVQKKFNLKKSVILSYLNFSKEIGRNVFNQWGLVSWPEITPRRLKDKIYLILKKEKRPLHFAELEKLINKNFPEKKICVSTIHNELIFEKEFVLVGRGIYALREQGYKPGVVAEVVIDVLKKEGRPMSRLELIEAVLKQRLVKKQTIGLALTALCKENRIKRTGRGEYILIEESKVE